MIGSGFAPNASVTYQYDPLNRLTQAAYLDGRTVQYTYDAAGTWPPSRCNSGAAILPAAAFQAAPSARHRSSRAAVAGCRQAGALFRALQPPAFALVGARNSSANISPAKPRPENISWLAVYP